MPHELSMDKNGEAEMFYIGDTPWHGLGQRLDGPATAAEAIAAAHLDWEVELVPAYHKDDTIQGFAETEPYRFVRRKDNGKILAMRTKKYGVVQNVDCFGLFDAAIGPGAGVYHTAGALKEGRVVWILAKAGDGREVVAGDTIEPFILLATSHDGSLPLTMRHTYIRVVCNNTFQYALGRSKKTDIVTIYHSGNVESKAVKAREELGLNNLYFDRMMEGVEQLVKAPMKTKSMLGFVNTLVRPWNQTDDTTPRDAAAHYALRDARNTLEELFEAGRGQDIQGVGGTAYAALNATTEFVDYFQRVGHGKVGEPNADRLHKAWFGTGRDLKYRAWNLLQDYSKRGNRAFKQPKINA